MPPIIFSAGYTLKKKNFMKNFHYIMSLGIFGSLLNMMVSSVILLFGNKYILSYDSQIYPIECLILASVLSASDTISALTIISESSYQTLHSILFGEGIVNDSVSILLTRSILSLSQDPHLNNSRDEMLGGL